MMSTLCFVFCVHLSFLYFLSAYKSLETVQVQHIDDTINVWILYCENSNLVAWQVNEVLLEY